MTDGGNGCGFTMEKAPVPSFSTKAMLDVSPPTMAPPSSNWTDTRRRFFMFWDQVEVIWPVTRAGDCSGGLNTTSVAARVPQTLSGLAGHQVSTSALTSMRSTPAMAIVLAAAAGKPGSTTGTRWLSVPTTAPSAL
ncbi:MAG: hypothetical protein R2690_13560 [Acidimicrobiales bacterium]